ASGNGSLALGQAARASGDGSTAVGGGQGATASGTNSVALGQGAQALATNSVAIGNNTVADQPNTVSLGGRRLTNIAPGISSNDAATLGQVNQLSKRANGGIATAMAMGGIAVPESKLYAVSANVGVYRGETALAPQQPLSRTPARDGAARPQTAHRGGRGTRGAQKPRPARRRPRANGPRCRPRRTPGFQGGPGRRRTKRFEPRARGLTALTR